MQSRLACPSPTFLSNRKNKLQLKNTVFCDAEGFVQLLYSLDCTHKSNQVLTSKISVGKELSLTVVWTLT